MIVSGHQALSLTLTVTPIATLTLPVASVIQLALIVLVDWPQEAVL